jgi:small conductance mechanosensitive channel
MMAILVPCFSLIWRERTKTHTKEECTLLADAVLKQSDVEQKRIEKSDQFLETYLCALNALSGWAWAYGGTDEEELQLIWESAEYAPEGTAVFRDGEYAVLLGAFPEKDFLSALQKTRAEREKRAAEEEEGSSSVLLAEGDTVYLSSLLPHAGTEVISRMAAVPELKEDADRKLDLMKLAGSLLSDAGVGIAMIRLDDHTVLQADGIPELRPGDSLEAEPDENGRLILGGTRYIAGVSEDASYRVIAVVPESAIFSKTIVSPITLALVFTAVFLLTGLYAWFLRTDYLRGRVEEENPGSRREHIGELLLRHVRLVFYLVAGCAVLLILLDCTLHVVDSTRVWGNRILSDVERYFEADDRNADLLASYRKEHKISVLDITRDLIEASPERMTDDALQDLSGAIERDLFVLDGEGTVVAASRTEYDFSGISDPESGLYALNSVLDGKADHKSFTVSDGETATLMCWAARCKNTDRILVSMDDLTQNISFSDYYADYRVPSGLVLFVVDLETGEILSGSDESYYGKSAESIGLTDEVLVDGFAADITLNGKQCFVQTNVYGGRADVIAADHGYLLRVYAPVVALTVVFGLLMVLLMFRLVTYIQKDVWTVSPDEVRNMSGLDRPEAADEDNAGFYREQGGDLHADRGAVGRWLSMNTPFRHQSADEKFRTVLYLLFIAVFAIWVLIHQHRQSAERMDRAFTWLLQRSWNYGLNIYAICYALMSFLLIITVALLLRRLILILGKKLGTRGETIARLISSFIAYASIIIAFAHCLIYVGVNTTAILASAGIVGLAISIGAKDLIADILAGIFIVFEGEFRTGDIVEIGGYRGTVEEIGVRTTKVMSMENVKIFRNSNISGVINMTQRFSIAQVRVDVSRAEPYERVEAVFREGFKEIRERIPQAVSEIELCGIDQLNARSMVLLVQTKCRESDRIEVERLLRRELGLLMEREKIASA